MSQQTIWLNDEQLVKLAKLIKAKKVTTFDLTSRQAFYESSRALNYSVQVSGVVHKFNARTLYYILIGVLGKPLPENSKPTVEIEL